MPKIVKIVQFFFKFKFCRGSLRNGHGPQLVHGPLVGNPRTRERFGEVKRRLSVRCVLCAGWKLSFTLSRSCSSSCGCREKTLLRWWRTRRGSCQQRTTEQRLHRWLQRPISCTHHRLLMTPGPRCRIATACGRAAHFIYRQLMLRAHLTLTLTLALRQVCNSTAAATPQHEASPSVTITTPPHSA